MIKSTEPTTFTEEERAYAEALFNALQPFVEIRHTMPLQYLVTFLRVVKDEGKGVTEYAADAGISKTVMTRHLLDIGERNRDHEAGFGLVYQKRDFHDMRINRTFATIAGRTTFLKMIEPFKRLAKRMAR